MPLNPGNAGAPAVENVAVAEDNIGILSSKVSFVQPLGNPLRIDTTKVKGENGEDEVSRTSFIVGYRFKAMEDIDVPDCGTTEAFKKDYMNYDEAKLNDTKHVAAGEIFDLTPFETALMGSWPEFNKMFTGAEGPAVVCAYAKQKVQSESGQVGEIPRAVLRLASTQGSIKDYGILDVCEKKMIPGPDGKEIKTGEIKAGFEKWAPLCIRAERKSARPSAGGVKKNTYDKNAQSFLNLLKSKGYQH